MDRLIPAEIEHETYPSNFLMLLRCSCTRRSTTPEPFFTRTTDGPSATAAIDADEHDSGHPKPEHRHW